MTTRSLSDGSRSQAIEDGVLIDVSQTAVEAGIRYPVALSRSAALSSLWVG